VSKRYPTKANRQEIPVVEYGIVPVGQGGYGAVFAKSCAAGSAIAVE
jgi:hypothetical protein